MFLHREVRFHRETPVSVFEENLSGIGPLLLFLEEFFISLFGAIPSESESRTLLDDSNLSLIKPFAREIFAAVNNFDEYPNKLFQLCRNTRTTTGPHPHRGGPTPPLLRSELMIGSNRGRNGGESYRMRRSLRRKVTR